MSAWPRRAASRVAAWSRTEARRRPVYAVAAGLGLLALIAVFGFGHLIGTSSYWDRPHPDSRAYVMGYRYFLHEPWQWPVFVTHTMNVPFSKSIAFTDSIPLWALANKTLATIVPPWGTFTERAYIGLWYGIVWALQPCLGVACVRALGHRSWFAALVTAVFFIAVPAWAERYVHASLSAHFLTLWALLLYIRSSVGGPPTRRLRIVQIVQLGVTTMINPYHAVFSFGLFLASLLQARRLLGLAWAAAGLATIGIGAWFAGYFAPEAKLAVGGFDVASANALTFFIPRRSGLVGESMWIDPTGFQYEGAAFLGAGLLVLVVLLVPAARTAGRAIRRHPFLFAVALGAGLFSLSNQIFVGPYHVFGFDVPKRLSWVAEQFRVPGRFVWIPMYVLVLFLLHQGLGRFANGWKRAILPALAILQLVDITGTWRALRDFTAQPVPTQIAIEAWRPLIHAHRAITILPSYDCVLDGTPGLDRVSVDIQYLASERALPINGVYSARPTRDCSYDLREMTTLTPADGMLYVVMNRVRSVGQRLAYLGAACAEFTFGQVCSRNATAIAEAIRTGGLTPIEPGVLPTVAFGTNLRLSDPAVAPGFDHGWSYAESWGRWTDGPGARLTFRTTGEPPASPTLMIAMSVPLCGSRTEADVDVTLNAVPLGTLHFDASNNDAQRARTLRIPDPALVRGSVSTIEFRPHDVRRPDKIGCNPDPRQLGAAVEWLQIY